MGDECFGFCLVCSLEDWDCSLVDHPFAVMDMRRDKERPRREKKGTLSCAMGFADCLRSSISFRERLRVLSFSGVINGSTESLFVSLMERRLL
jgi:hypothetical protein